MNPEVELSGPYQQMYEELCEQFSKEKVDEDINKIIKNKLHESYGGVE